MVFGLFRRKKKNQQIVAAIYDRLTASSRHPALYEAMGAPDTVMGRFEMIAVHMVIFFRRTGQGGPAVRDLAQEIVDAFFEDIDHSIREIGIGDMGVPKRMKKFARMFYGRYESYAAAIDAGDREALRAALARNIYPPQHDGSPNPAARDVTALSDYVISRAGDLMSVSDEEILAGQVAIRPPEPRSAAAVHAVGGR
jgi:cytochrome b pre-mRNA-processing protein 3